MVEDFFALLELPIESDDKDTIERAIEVKRRAWSAESDPRKRERCQIYLQQLPHIRQVMLDPDGRAALRQQLQVTRQEDAARRLSAARTVYRSLAASGYLTRAQRDEFVRKYSHPAGPTEQELLQVIRVPIRDAASPEEPKRPPATPRHELEEIARQLELCNADDLYAFLGAPRNAETSGIERRQKELQREWSVKLHGPLRTAAESCLALVAKHLLNPERRSAYDRALEEQRLAPVQDALKILLKSKHLDSSQVQELLNLARDLRVGRERALEVIREEAQKAGAAIEVASGGTQVDERLCGSCGSVSPTGSRFCSGCRLPLDLTCPRCKTSVPSSSELCQGCSMATPAILLYAHDLGRFRARLTDRDLTGAAAGILAATKVYKGCEEILALQREVSQRLDQVEALRRQGEQAVSARQL